MAPEITFYTLPEVCEGLHAGDRTVRRWVANGELHAHRAGRRLLFAPDDVAAFMRLRRVQPRPRSISA